MAEQELAPKRVKYSQGKHPNCLKNLKPFPKGSNGGLNRQGYSLTSALKDRLAKPLPLKEPDADAPARDHIVYSTIVGAKLREPVPFREVWDRVDGKVPQDIGLRGEVVIRVLYDAPVADMGGQGSTESDADE